MQEVDVVGALAVFRSVDGCEDGVAPDLDREGQELGGLLRHLHDLLRLLRVVLAEGLVELELLRHQLAALDFEAGEKAGDAELAGRVVELGSEGDGAADVVVGVVGLEEAARFGHHGQGGFEGGLIDVEAVALGLAAGLHQRQVAQDAVLAVDLEVGGDGEGDLLVVGGGGVGGHDWAVSVGGPAGSAAGTGGGFFNSLARVPRRRNSSGTLRAVVSASGSISPAAMRVLM